MSASSSAKKPCSALTRDGKPKVVTEYTADSFDAPDFPVIAVKPIILQAAQRAMALRVFDRIGLAATDAKGDPILMAQILDPRGHGRRVTFFVAWWLNVEDL